MSPLLPSFLAQMVSATANMLTVIAQTGAIVDSVSISGRWAIVTVIMGGNEKATESHLLWSTILVASGCIILGKDGELAFASAKYSLILALYIYIQVPVILSFCHVLSCSVVFCLEVCGFEPNQSRWLSGFLGAGPSAFSSRLQTQTDS